MSVWKMKNLYTKIQDRMSSYVYFLNTLLTLNTPSLFSQYYIVCGMLSLLSCGVFLQVNCFVKMTAMITGNSKVTSLKTTFLLLYDYLFIRWIVSIRNFLSGVHCPPEHGMSWLEMIVYNSDRFWVLVVCIIQIWKELNHFWGAFWNIYKNSTNLVHFSS